LQQAINEFTGGSVPRDRAARLELIEQIKGKAADVWDQLDEQFYKKEEDLDQLNIEYIRQNKEEFK
jgi:hypothetical protein